MSERAKKKDHSQDVFILAGTVNEFLAIRQHLKIVPGQAVWLTLPSDLDELHHPKIYRSGSWRTLPRIQEIEAAMSAAEANVVDLS